jgi:hypothetical protein
MFIPFCRLVVIPETSGLVIPCHAKILGTFVVGATEKNVELQINVSLVDVINGVAFTVMLKDVGFPTQLTPKLVKVGVTVILEILGVETLFTAKNSGVKESKPLLFSPVVLFRFDQLYELLPPEFTELKNTDGTESPLQTAMFGIGLICPF